MILAIFKQIDRWFIAIGFGGILFTVLFWLGWMYYLKYGEATLAGFSKMTVKSLDTLVVRIESHKDTAGSYPETLDKLTFPGSDLLKLDPLLMRRWDEDIPNNQIRYRRIENHYTLYSVGVDGVENTRDDLFPRIVDSIKSGWVKR
jgi:hypothetical protein